MSIDKLTTTASLEELIDKIEEIGAQLTGDSFKLNIEICNTLPSIVENGKVVILDSSKGSLYIDNKEVSEVTGLTDGDIYIRCGESSEISTISSITSNTQNIYFYLNEFYKYQNETFINIRKSIYVGINGKWEKLKEDAYIFVNGEYPIYPIINTNSGSGTYTVNVITDRASSYYNNMHIYSKMDSSTSSFAFSMQNKIDITSYSKILIKGVFNESSAGANISFGVASSNSNTSFSTKKTVKSNAGETEITIDVSNLSGEYYFKICASNNFVSSFTFNFYISEIKLCL